VTAPACQICRGVTTAHVKSGKYRYWHCDRCATSQVLPQPTLDELAAFYDSFHLSNDGGGRYDDVEERMQADFPVKARMARAAAPHPGATLLDVGTGKGFFVREANRVGFDATGMDVSASGIDYAKETLGVKAVKGSVVADAPPEWANAFDVATLWATIEHVPNPGPVLKAMYGCLKPGGTIFVDTGLAGKWVERFLPGHSQWYDAPQHLWVFGAEGLRTLLIEAGFTDVAIDTNFDRSALRRTVRLFRNSAVCLGGYLATRLPLGGAGYRNCRTSTKWPIGFLVSCRATKPR
jgi:SAM-dependent methyltransferase